MKKLHVFSVCIITIVIFLSLGCSRKGDPMSEKPIIRVLGYENPPHKIVMMDIAMDKIVDKKEKK